MNNRYEPVIGLEVHVELKTDSKMFCGCSADYFGKEPNTHTCPVCLGLPGALPVPNKKAVDWCVMIGIALGCKIPASAKFDRKNYFYPDLPKGYQISQYDQPFCINGSMTLRNGKKIRIRRVHMEEDTGKLSHLGSVTLIDFNRSGVPLVEIVTEPDFETTEEVTEYLKRLQQLVRYLDVSNADMERGDMRLEPNISLREIKSQKSKIKSNDHLPTYKVEVKNINSFRFVAKAIEFEIKRQAEILDKGETPKQETRGWNEAKNETDHQRTKEEAQDYRYFPEPDIPPIIWDSKELKDLKAQIPELPWEKEERFVSQLGLKPGDARILIEENSLAGIFEKIVEIGKNKGFSAQGIANYVINQKIDLLNDSPEQIIDDIKAKKSEIVEDEEKIKDWAKTVIEENPKAVNDFKKGKENAIQVLIGAAMRKSKDKADVAKVKDILKLLLQ